MLLPVLATTRLVALTLLPLTIGVTVPLSVSHDTAQATTLPTSCLSVFPPEEPLPNSDGVREVSTASHLTWLASSSTLGAPQFGSHIELANDIDLQGCLWPGAYQPGGVDRLTRTTIPEGFYGIFDGDGQKISNFVMTSDPTITDSLNAAPLGFFDAVNGEASIRNITFDNVTMILAATSFGDVASNYAMGIVAGDVGSATGANPTLSAISVTRASISLQCDSSAGCILQNVGGLIGFASAGTVTNISVDGTISITATGSNVDQTDGDGTVVSLLPGSSSLQSVGMLAGFISGEASAQNVTASGLISSTVSTSTVGGLFGAVSDAEVTRAHSTVDIQVGDITGGIPTQVALVENIGGAVGVSTFGTPTLSSVSSSGDISLLVAAFQENNPAQQSLQKIGGLVGLAIDTSTITDTATEGSLTVEVRDLGNTTANVAVTAVGGLIGRSEDNVSVQRALVRRGINTTNIDSTTTTSAIGAFVGDVVGTTVSVSDGFWDTSITTVSSSAAGTAKTGEQLSQSATYAGWSLSTTWIPAWSVGDPLWGLCEGSEEARPFLQWRTTQNPCPTEATGVDNTSRSPSVTSSSNRGWFDLGAVTLGFPATVGQPALGTPIAVSGSQMQPGSVVVTQVRSTPTILNRVAVQSTGIFDTSSSLPGLPAGDHRLLIDGIDREGNPWLITVRFGVDSEGHFSWVGNPTLSPFAELARTGPPPHSTSSLIGGLAFAILGGILMLVRLRLRARDWPFCLGSG